MAKLSVGLFQMDVAWGDPEENLKKVSQWLSKWEMDSPDVVVLPELWTTSYENERLKQHAIASEKALEMVAGWARRTLSWVVCGSLPWLDSGHLYNRTFVINDAGEVEAQYDKVHLFPLLEEPKYFTPGAAPCFFSIGNVKCACATCYDLRFPEYVRALALSGIEVLFLPAEWPLSRIEAWRILLQARAIENQIFVIGCNRSGEGGSEVYGGHSMIVAPEGSILAEGVFGEGDLFALLDMRMVQDTRKTLPVYENRRKELYTMVTSM